MRYFTHFGNLTEDIGIGTNVVLRNVYAASDQVFTLKDTGIVWIAVSHRAKVDVVVNPTLYQVVTLWDSFEQLMEVCIPRMACDRKAIREHHIP
jgi:hypothetical protein